MSKLSTLTPVYLTREHCNELRVEYMDDYLFYIRIERLILLRQNWDTKHTDMLEYIIAKFGICSTLRLERCGSGQPLRADDPGWYRITNIVGMKGTWSIQDE